VDLCAGTETWQNDTFPILSIPQRKKRMGYRSTGELEPVNVCGMDRIQLKLPKFSRDQTRGLC